MGLFLDCVGATRRCVASNSKFSRSFSSLPTFSAGIWLGTGLRGRETSHPHRFRKLMPRHQCRCSTEFPPPTSPPFLHSAHGFYFCLGKSEALVPRPSYEPAVLLSPLDHLPTDGLASAMPRRKVVNASRQRYLPFHCSRALCTTLRERLTSLFSIITRQARSLMRPLISKLPRFYNAPDSYRVILYGIQ